MGNSAALITVFVLFISFIIAVILSALLIYVVLYIEHKTNDAHDKDFNEFFNDSIKGIIEETKIFFNLKTRERGDTDVL